MNLLVVLIIVLLVAGAGVGPYWGYSANWGYAPMGGIVGILVIILLLKLLGVI